MLGWISIFNVQTEICAFRCSLHEALVNSFRHTVVLVDPTTVKLHFKSSRLRVIANGTDITGTN